MGKYLDEQGNYYEGDRLNPSHVEVAEPPKAVKIKQINAKYADKYDAFKSAYQAALLTGNETSQVSISQQYQATMAAHKAEISGVQ